MQTELAQRENDGIAVTLLWHSLTDRLTVAVRDGRTGEAFDLNAEARNAMDIFHHPYAYAARRGAGCFRARPASLSTRRRAA